MKTHFKYMFIASILLLLSCQKERVFYELDLASNAAKIEGEVVLQSKVEGDYFFDLKADENSFYFLYKNEKGNGVLAVYDNDFTLKQEQRLFEKLPVSMNAYPHFTHEVIQEHPPVLHIVSERSHLWQLQSDGEKSQFKVLDVKLPGNGVDYNVVSSDEFWISSTLRMWRSPFFSLINGCYNWITPDSLINQNYQNDVPFVAHLSVNGEQRKAVIAYRFIDFLSFYDFNGYLEGSVKIRSKILPSEIRINNPNTPKYFIDLYGTEQYIYCLYSGSRNLDVPARVIKFNWTGKHIQTYLLDRSIHSFAINERRNILVAISSNKNSGKQEIVKYTLNKAKL